MLKLIIMGVLAIIIQALKINQFDNLNIQAKPVTNALPKNPFANLFSSKSGFFKKMFKKASTKVKEKRTQQAKKVHKEDPVVHLLRETFKDP